MSLWPLEEKMVCAAGAGELADGGKGSFELAEMKAWGKARTIRAEVLRHLLVEELWAIASRGVRLRGLRIIGHLDLLAAKLRCPLSLDSCYLDGPSPALGFASVPLLEIKRCYLAGLDAESLVVSADLDLSESTFSCPIRLEGAAITGQLNCCSARLEGSDESGDALVADGLKVGGDLVLSKRFTAAGAIRLIGADIIGQLNCCDAELNGAEKDGSALIADTVRIGGGVFLSEGFIAEGAIRLPGADITAQLSCSSAQLRGKDEHGCALHAAGMKVGGDVCLDKLSTDAKAGAIQLPGAIISGQLSCRGAHLDGMDNENNSLHADSMRVGGRLVIDEKFTAAGTVRLAGARITGRFRCCDAELRGKDKRGRALLADEMTVGGGVAITDVSITHGAIHMVGADIMGNLRCENVCLAGTDVKNNAVVADSVKVGNGVTIYNVAAVAGAIRLPGAHITGRLRCGGVKLKGKDKPGRALLADGFTVSGGAWFGGVCTERGALRMVGADIKGDLHCEGVRLMGTDGHGGALVADRINVSGSVFLGVSRYSGSECGSIAEGAVSLRSARVGGSLELKPEKLPEGNDPEGKQKVALDLAGAKIAHSLVWVPSHAVRGTVILDDAEVGQLEDDLELSPLGRWPSACDGSLRLDGFTYRRICEESKGTLQKRLAWLGSPDKRPDRRARAINRPIFTTQPYEQLATAYQSAGQDTEARKVAIARRRDLRRYGDLTRYRKIGNWLLDNSIRYGYRTWRAVVALAVLYAAAFVIFVIAQHHSQLIVPTMQIGLNPVPTAIHCGSNYPCFYPAAYAIDTIIPVINVRQAAYWGPNGQAPWGHALEVFTSVSTILGWALATLAVAGYTGLVRRN